MNHFPVLLAVSLLSLSVNLAHADQISVLGSADSYAVLGGSTVTNTGSTVLSGNLGVFPGTSITGFTPGLITNGSIDSDSAASSAAQTDAAAGYAYLAGLTPTNVLTGEDLGNLTLAPGVYSYASSAELTGPLTLDFEGLNNANIIFQIGSTFTTASGSSVSVIHQGLNDNVYYQVGSSATLGTGTVFEGDILADASVTLTTGANITCGSAIALNGAVTMDTNMINNCSTTGSDVSPYVSPTHSGLGDGSPSATPEPQSLWLVITGVFGGAGVLRRQLAA